jgi:hypothetical protein
MMSAVESKAPLTWHNWVNLLGYLVNFVVTWVSLTGVFGATNSDLSKKYQTLVTPASWAFAIWGPIFIWEGVFAVAQMLPSLRSSETARAMAPYWALASLSQTLWTPVFSQQLLAPSLIFMYGTLLGLVGASLSADQKKMSQKEYWLLRAPISLHLGWIICASAVNTNSVFDFYKAEPHVLLAVAIASFAVIAVAVALFALAAPRPDAWPSLVAAWALAAVSAELKDGKLILSPTRFNPFAWPSLVLQGLSQAAEALSILCLVLAFVAASRRIFTAYEKRSSDASFSEMANVPLA